MSCYHILMPLQLQEAQSSSRASGGECSPAGEMLGRAGTPRADHSGVPGSHLSSPAVSWGLSGVGAQGDPFSPGPSYCWKQGKGMEVSLEGTGQPWFLSAACRLSGPACLLPGMQKTTVVRQACVSPVLPHPPEMMSCCSAPVVCTAAPPGRPLCPVPHSPACLMLSHKSILFLE